MVWEDITKTGRAPGTGEKLSRAYLWGQPGRKGKARTGHGPPSPRRPCAP